MRLHRTADSRFLLLGCWLLSFLKLGQITLVAYTFIGGMFGAASRLRVLVSRAAGETRVLGGF